MAVWDGSSDSGEGVSLALGARAETWRFALRCSGEK